MRLKIKYILLLLLLVWVNFVACRPSSIKKLSREIHRQNIIPSNFAKRSLRIHKQVLRQPQAEFLNQKKDTVYLLESYDIQSGQIVGSIWNRDGILNFQSNMNKVQVLAKTHLPVHIIQLVSAFDTVQIRQRESLAGKQLGGAYYIAIRAFYIKDKLMLESISFDAVR